MLWRFCLYGFLKNQRYFEPFIVLAFLDRGYSFFAIGLILGFRELCANVMEIPSGAAADVLGRRRSMIISSLMYVLAFVLLGLVRSLPLVLLAMYFFSIGEAFRTGTHKAIIFSWLKANGRDSEKTRIYGLTRSFSKLGSALSSLIAAAMLVWLNDYDVIFWLSAIPSALNVVNFLSYPRYLDGSDGNFSIKDIAITFFNGLWQCIFKRPLRGLLAESMCYEGLFKVSQGYLQPIIQAAALSLPWFLGFQDDHRTYILVGLVYFVMQLAASYASRKASWWQDKFAGAAAACRALWWMYLGVFIAIVAYSFTQSIALAIAGFFVMFITQNFWRPILVSRVADSCDGNTMATVLSVESQAKNLFAAALMPLVGLAVDAMSDHWRFLPPGALGLFVVAAVLVITARPKRSA